MCLDKGEIGLAILRRFAFHEHFFRVGQFRLERVCDFVREIALDCKNIGQITVVREITLRSPILDKFVRMSSWIPSAKYAFSFSSLRFSNGNTAIDLSILRAA